MHRDAPWMNIGAIRSHVLWRAAVACRLRARVAGMNIGVPSFARASALLARLALGLGSRRASIRRPARTSALSRPAAPPCASVVHHRTVGADVACLAGGHKHRRALVRSRVRAAGAVRPRPRKQTWLDPPASANIGALFSSGDSVRRRRSPSAVRADLACLAGGHEHRGALVRPRFRAAGAVRPRPRKRMWFDPLAGMTIGALSSGAAFALPAWFPIGPESTRGLRIGRGHPRVSVHAGFAPAHR